MRQLAAPELEEDSDSESTERSILIKPEDALPENIYSMALACSVRDWHALVVGTDVSYMKGVRLELMILCVTCVLGIQFYLIYETKALVTPESVHNARETYSKFQEMMYTDNAGVQHTELTVNGLSRGIPGFFNASNFYALTDQEKEDVCQLPLTQPLFCITILYIWTLTCLADLRQALNSCARIVYGAPTISSMKASIEELDSDNVKVVGLTSFYKIMAVILIFIPRVLIGSVLLWMGCRWLLATSGFSNLLLNAVALEFILLLRELLYVTIVPRRLQRITTNTGFPHTHDTEAPSFCGYFGMFMVGIAAFIWVLLYMYAFQRVLPDYRWDVHGVCEDYLAAELAV